MTKTLLIVLVGFAVACGGDDLVIPSEGAPAAITIVAGDAQAGRVGEPLANPVVAEVTDSRNRPVTGVEVAFEFVGGAGSAITPEIATTGTDGRVSAQLTLGGQTGTARGEVRVVGSDDLEAEFTVIGVSTDASVIRAVSGDGQTAPAGTALPEPLVVRAIDPFNNPIPGVSITWSVDGGGSVSDATTVTGADGRASVQRTLGSAAGTQTTRASASGLAGSPVLFTHVATAGGASRVTRVSGNNQTGAVGTRLPQELVIEVLDANNNPVSGAGVTWVVKAGGGSVDPTTGTTGSNGRTSTRWTLGSAPGTNTVDAVVSGVGTVTFTATATTGASASLAVRTQPPATVTVGATFGQHPVVQLRDAAGNDVTTSGVAVTAAIASGGGTLSGTTTRTTDATGRATFNDLRISGATGSHTLIFAASGHTSVTSNAITVGQASTTTNISSDAPDPSAPGQAVTVAFSVTSSSGTPTGTVTVTASGGGESCSAGVSAGSCVITLSASGSRTLTATYGGDALFQGSSDTESHQVQAVNGAPTAVNDGYTTLEGFEKTLVVDPPGVLANDTDPDGNALQAINASDPPNGSVTLNPNGSFTYNPEPDFWGDDAFTYQATDGTTPSNTATVAITVLPVNDAPRFRLLAGDQTVSATAGPQQVAGFAEIVSPGAPNEQGQVLEFIVEVDAAGAGLFAQAPSISADGTLSYAPSGTAGSALITVRLRDNGGTANGGQDTSDAQTFTITFTNDG